MDGTLPLGKDEIMAMKFVNQVYFDIPATPNHRLSAHEIREDIAPQTLLVHDLLSTDEASYIMDKLAAANWFPVSITGMGGNYQPGDIIGSYRASNYTQEFADVLWSRISHLFPTIESFSGNFPTDFDDHQTWEPVTVSPLLRFIRYRDGGCLVPHYDAPYIQDDDVRTLKSFVIYLDEDEDITGGATRFLHDSQAELPVQERELSDRLELATEDEVRVPVRPRTGSGLIFPHRVWHDSEPVSGTGAKTIIRTDILYKRV